MDVPKETIGHQIILEDVGSVTPEVKDEIQQFISQETKKFRELYPKNLGKDNKEYMDELNHAFILQQANLILSEALEPVTVDSRVTLAKIDGQTAGFSIITFVKENGKLKVDTTFTGVGREYRRKGIATRLIEDRHDYLRKKGITEYDIALWEKSLAVYDKMQRKGELMVEPTTLDGRQFIVRLNPRD